MSVVGSCPEKVLSQEHPHLFSEDQVALAPLETLHFHQHPPWDNGVDRVPLFCL